MSGMFCRRHRPRRPWVGAVICLVALGFADPSRASAALCDAAAIAAARDSGVPQDIMLSLTRVETGRGGPADAPDPWPWTLNIAGQGAWYHDAATALSAATQAIADGTRNIDIGCFQLSLRWHGANFADLAAMLDPVQNARYAAAFLSDLHAEFGDWTVVAGVFHSRNPDAAAPYLARFARIRAALSATRAGAGAGPLTLAARPALATRSMQWHLPRADPLATMPARPIWELR